MFVKNISQAFIKNKKKKIKKKMKFLKRKKSIKISKKNKKKNYKIKLSYYIIFLQGLNKTLNAIKLIFKNKFQNFLFI